MTNDEVLQKIDQHYQEYKEEIKKKEAWLNSRANWARIWYHFARGSLIILGILVPFLIEGGLGENPKKWGHFLTLVIAIVAALEGHFKWGEMWSHCRSYQLNLESAKRTYENHRLKINSIDDDKEKLTKANSLYLTFVDTIEKLLQEETGGFFSKRIQDSSEER